MNVDSCREKKTSFQDIILQIQHWERIEDGRLLVRASGDYKGESIGVEAVFRTDMRPVDYNPVTNAINIIDPETVYADGILFRSMGKESDELVKAMSDLYGISLVNYRMAEEVSFTVLCLESENNDPDEFCQKYQLLIDEEEGKDTYGELFLNIDMDLGSMVLSEGNIEYRKNILGAFTGEGVRLSYKLKAAAAEVGNYFNAISERMKMAKLSMKLEAVSKESIRIIAIPTEEDKIPLGVSKFGGHPDLPADFHWPEWRGMSLSFVGQINLKDLVGLKPASILPPSGILYFFYDAADQTVWGFDPDDKDGFRVVFADEKQELLKRWDFPEDVLEDCRFDCGVLKFSVEKTFPSIDSVFLDTLELSEGELETYVKMMEDPDGVVAECTANRLLGFPDLISGEMETLCSLVDHGEYCGGIVEIEEDKLDEYLKDALEWQLLLQVDSLDKLGFLWGDAGRIYFWIREKDLKNRDFSKIWLIKQSN